MGMSKWFILGLVVWLCGCGEKKKGSVGDSPVGFEATAVVQLSEREEMMEGGVVDWGRAIELIHDEAVHRLVEERVGLKPGKLRGGTKVEAKYDQGQLQVSFLHEDEEICKRAVDLLVKEAGRRFQLDVMVEAERHLGKLNRELEDQERLVAESRAELERLLEERGVMEEKVEKEDFQMTYEKALRAVKEAGGEPAVIYRREEE